MRLHDLSRSVVAFILTSGFLLVSLSPLQNFLSCFDFRASQLSFNFSSSKSFALHFVLGWGDHPVSVFIREHLFSIFTCPPSFLSGKFMEFGTWPWDRF